MCVRWIGSKMIVIDAKLYVSQGWCFARLCQYRLMSCFPLEFLLRKLMVNTVSRACVSCFTLRCFRVASLSTPIREALYCPFYQSLESVPNPNLTAGTIARDRHAQMIAVITMKIALSTMRHISRSAASIFDNSAYWEYRDFFVCFECVEHRTQLGIQLTWVRMKIRKGFGDIRWESESACYDWPLAFFARCRSLIRIYWQALLWTQNCPTASQLALQVLLKAKKTHKTDHAKPTIKAPPRQKSQ